MAAFYQYLFVIDYSRRRYLCGSSAHYDIFELLFNGARARARVCVCVCACVYVSACMCACERMCTCVSVFAGKRVRVPN